MVGREDAMGNEEPPPPLPLPLPLPLPPGSKRMFWRSASWSASRTQPSQPSDDTEDHQHLTIPSGQTRRFAAPPPLTPRSHHNSSKARACLPPLQPLAISRRSLDEWPKAGSDDVGEWPHPPTTPSGGGNERLKLDLSSTQNRVSDKSSGLAKREKIACFDKECSKVADHIYVGGDAVAKDKEILKNNGITHILNCVGFICPEYFKSEFCYRSLWLRDSPSEDITSILYDVFDYFEDVREQSGRIFVHCCQGVSRSTSLVIAYLMWREGQSFDDAFQYVKSARGIADPNMGFACQLLQCQKRVHAFPLSPTSLLRMYKMSPHSPYDPLHLVPKLLNDPSPSSLDSRGAFILQLPSAIYIWVGRQCESIMEVDAKAAVCQIARYEKVEAPIMVVREGEEPGYYWDAFASILPMIGGDGVKTQTCERKVEAYNLDFEIFQKAIEGGFVPTLASSNNEDETHLPVRENSWSSLKCKFASRFERGFRSVSKTPLSRVYSDSMMIVHALGSPSSSKSTTTTSSSSSPVPFLSPDSANSSNSRKSFSQTSLRSSPIPPPLILPKFASLSLLPSQETVDSDLPHKEMRSLSGQTLACRWPSMEMITEVSRGYFDSESVIAILLPSDEDVGENISRVLYIWIGKSFSFDVDSVDWVQIGESLLSHMDLPKDTPIKIVREGEDQTEFLALLSAL